MALQRIFTRGKPPLSLSIRVSGLLMLAAIVPLIVTVATIEFLSRPTLIAQASQKMETDAQTHTQLIDSYFSERILETEALSRLQPIQAFLGGDSGEGAKERALASLTTGHGRGSYYEDWSLFNLQGDLQLYYPTSPELHGHDYIPRGALQQLQTSRQALLSGVFFSPASNEGYIDIYTPVTTSSYKQVGILRASFDLRYVWDIVDREAGVNGDGSYAFILDQNGVRIAQTKPGPNPFSFTNASNLFTAVSPLSSTTQQRVESEGMYGVGSGGVRVEPNQTLTDVQQNKNPSPTFQMIPAGQQETFQVARSTTYTVPWTYFVASPLHIATTVADDQLRITLIITFAILLLAALIGAGVGRRITRPILRSVEYLLDSSQALKALAIRERSAVTQQTWVVDSTQVGLQSVQYYTEAANLAVRRLTAVSTDLTRNWQQIDPALITKVLNQIVSDGQYVEKAVHYQDDSNKKLASAIKVTTQVADQLAAGADATSNAAEQLEQVVNELRQVVGK